MSKGSEYVIPQKQYPSLVLGLDISTACIGISIIYDDGENEPQVEIIHHVAPKINKDIKGIEALILRKKIFENDFLNRIDEYLKNIRCPLKKITECVIESPMIHSSGSSNAETVAKLLQFNGLLSESVYDKLGIVPFYISSYDARMYAFPELISLRKFNRRGEIYPVKHFEKALKDNSLILFGSYPFDVDKKNVMLNMVCEKYPNINWIYDKKNELKKENYDSCDALICCLAYSNLKRYGTLDNIKIISHIIIENSIKYQVQFWDRTIDKTLLF